MESTTQVIIDAARSLSSWVDAILPPLDVLRDCQALARTSSAIRERQIGRSESGQSLRAYEFGEGQAHVLFYGFPDPGEAVGGTTILALLRGLAEGDAFLLSREVTWHFIPCLNLDDQPDGGRSLAKVFRDPNIREVDWCVLNPRPETSALLDYVDSASPAFVFPLHDEYHSAEAIPVYVIVSELVGPVVSKSVRACLQRLGLPLRAKRPHKTMGAAFDLATDFGEEYLNSTFSRMAGHGLVAVCEVSQQEGIGDATLVAAQLAVGMCFLEAVLEKKRGNIEQRAAADADKPRR